jgi:hypothetical protein
MNVRGAIRSCEFLLAELIFEEGGGRRTLDTALSLGASAGRGERNVDAGERAGDDIVDCFTSGEFWDELKKDSWSRRGGAKGNVEVCWGYMCVVCVSAREAVRVGFFGRIGLPRQGRHR